MMGGMQTNVERIPPSSKALRRTGACSAFACAATAFWRDKWLRCGKCVLRVARWAWTELTLGNEDDGQRKKAVGWRDRPGIGGDDVDFGRDSVEWEATRRRFCNVLDDLFSLNGGGDCRGIHGLKSVATKGREGAA